LAVLDALERRSEGEGRKKKPWGLQKSHRIRGIRWTPTKESYCSKREEAKRSGFGHGRLLPRTRDREEVDQRLLFRGPVRKVPEKKLFESQKEKPEQKKGGGDGSHALGDYVSNEHINKEKRAWRDGGSSN